MMTMHAALKSVLLVVLFGVMLANADHTITCPCFGYSIDGGTCSSSGAAFTMTSGTTETLTIDAGCASGPHPVIITTAANSLSTYSGSSGSSSGVTGSSFTLTVPASTTQFDLFLTCHFHLFSKTITVMASSSGGGTSSTGTSSHSSSTAQHEQSSSTAQHQQSSSTGQHHQSSSTGVMESSSTAQHHQSSSTGVVESSSTAQQHQSSSSGVVESSSSAESSESSSESSSEESSSSYSSSESSSESAVISGSGDCTNGTWSPTGFHPCYPCAENTYANIRETECHACPEYTHIPSTDYQDSITRCICDDGYTSQYASGGPCYPINQTESSSSTGEQQESSSSSSGSQEEECTSSLTGYDCDSYSYCRSVYGYKCKDDKWEFIGCVLRSYFTSSVYNTTCAKNSAGKRAWFPESVIPDDWTMIDENHSLRKCCHHHHRCDDDDDDDEDDDGLGTTHCSFVNGSVCALAQYEGSCPSVFLLQDWREKIIEGVATVVSEQLNVSRAEATIGLDLASSNRTYDGESVCTLRAQVYPPEVGSLNGFDFLAALWDQLGGSSLLGSAKGKSVAGMGDQRNRRSRLLQSMRGLAAPPQDKIPRQDIIVSYPSHAIATYQMNASLIILLLIAIVATMWR